MSRRLWYIGGALIVGLATWISQPQGRSSVAAPRRSEAASETPVWFVGTSSCSARACHGGLEPIADPQSTPILRDEYPKWLLRDKHAHAYQLLLDESSLRIARHLAGEGVVLPPHKDTRCLACHAITTPDHNPTELRLGVSCEACHGRASEWLTLHTGAEWRNLTPEQKHRKWMIPTSDMHARAQACAECHVGSPGKDVNHDLIAAGHPRLNFEFSSFMANLPPHWNAASAKRQAAEEVWAVGQVESARAALRLLEYRADAKHNRPWPEFAEYDCFACHHDLEAASWRQKASSQRKPGTVPWGTWYFSMPSLLADGKLRAGLDNLKQELERPLPRRNLPIQSLVNELSTNRLGKLDANALSKFLTTSNSAGWDVAEQLFLAACVIHDSRKQPEIRKALAELSRYRALPPQCGSPKNFSPRFFEDFRKVLHEQK